MDLSDSRLAPALLPLHGDDLDPETVIHRESLGRYGQYDVVRHLATGGMAELYLARHQNDESPLVVIKRMRPELSTDPDVVRMFLDETALVASLRHTNIARVLDIGRENGDFYFAMEYLRGADVRDLLRRLVQQQRPLPLSIALSIIIDACSALEYAHAATDANGEPLSIVHRDISPHNIFVTYQGTAKILDFGIAKATLQCEETRAGAIKGKLHYLSPEQCQSHHLDHRSDIFSLCVVLWELTTGRRLFRGKSELEVMKKIVDEDAMRPSDVRPEYAVGLERIVMRGLARNPDDRFQTAAELREQLQKFAEQARLDVSSGSMSTFICDVFSDRVSVDVLDCAAEGSAGIVLHGPTGTGASFRRDRTEQGTPSTEEPGRATTQTSTIPLGERAAVVLPIVIYAVVAILFLVMSL